MLKSFVYIVDIPCHPHESGRIQTTDRNVADTDPSGKRGDDPR
jgi:hypothetical protein